MVNGIFKLNKDETIQIIIGKGGSIRQTGGTTSFGSYLSAAGGTFGINGNGGNGGSGGGTAGVFIDTKLLIGGTGVQFGGGGASGNDNSIGGNGGVWGGGGGGITYGIRSSNNEGDGGNDTIEAENGVDTIGIVNGGIAGPGLSSALYGGGGGYGGNGSNGYLRKTHKSCGGGGGYGKIGKGGNGSYGSGGGGGAYGCGADNMSEASYDGGGSYAHNQLVFVMELMVFILFNIG